MLLAPEDRNLQEMKDGVAEFMQKHAQETADGRLSARDSGQSRFQQNSRAAGFPRELFLFLIKIKLSINEGGQIGVEMAHHFQAHGDEAIAIIRGVDLVALRR